MDDTRKKAYRYLLYHGLLLIRNHTWAATGRYRWWNAKYWLRLRHGSRRANVIADCLHNLAQFAADDFDQFDEEWFWRDVESAHERYPEMGIDGLRGLFEQHLSDRW